jgi:hypothetical protein
VKLYEYLSAGKPVVATMLPELEPYAELIYRAEGPEDFLKQLEAALAESDDGLVQRRVEMAQQHQRGGGDVQQPGLHEAVPGKPAGQHPVSGL